MAGLSLEPILLTWGWSVNRPACAAPKMRVN